MGSQTSEEYFNFDRTSVKYKNLIAAILVTVVFLTIKLSILSAEKVTMLISLLNVMLLSNVTSRSVN